MSEVDHPTGNGQRVPQAAQMSAMVRRSVRLRRPSWPCPIWHPTPFPATT